MLFVDSLKVNTGTTLEERGLEPIGDIPLHGYINAIDIGPKAKFCVVAVGQEPRLGRWNRVAKAKNRLAIIKLSAKDAAGVAGSQNEASEAAIDEEYDQPPGVQSYSDGDDED
jgi:hypothetical protein